MIKIECGFSFEAERKYIIDTIFGDFLALEYEISFGDFRDYNICFDDKKLVVKDAFFGVYEEYLCKEAIPENVEFFGDLPIIYGEGEVESRKCGIDIFGSSYFMLSRFEEYVIEERDEFDRFKSSSSLAVRCGFEKRAVVNAYVELLWKMLVSLGFSEEAKAREFRVIFTHDVDHLYFWSSFLVLSQRVTKCLFKYHNFKQALKEIRDYALVKLKIEKDPYDRFEYLMDISEKYGKRSIFYILVGKEHSFDADFKRKDLKRVVQMIKKRGHTIALHPSFESYKDAKMVKREREYLEELCELKIEHSRQHYLRFEQPKTLHALQGLKEDSSLGFEDRVGFRCGCCYSFSLFDFLKKEKLEIRESPLIVMDGVLLEKEIDEAKSEVLEVAKEVKKYGGDFVLLWHNSSFFVDRWKKFDKFYEKILEEIA